MVPGRAMYTQPGVTWYSQVQPQTPRCSQNAARYSHVAASTARYNQCAAPVTDTAIVISVGQHASLMPFTIVNCRCRLLQNTEKL